MESYYNGRAMVIAKDPEKDFRTSASDLVEEIERWVADNPPPVLPPGWKVQFLTPDGRKVTLEV